MHRGQDTQKLGAEAPRRQTVVIAHGPCNDGRVAAWCHWRTQPAATKAQLAAEGGVYAPQADDASETPDAGGKRATSAESAARLLAEGCDTVYVFAQPLDRMPVGLARGRHLLLLDITLEASLRQLVEEAETAVVCDHHESARGLLGGLAAEYPNKLSVNFDTKRSGARIAWERFFPKQPLSPVVAYVEDRDLWQWRLPASREVNEALQVEGLLSTFGDIERLHGEWAPDTAAFLGLCTRGALYMRSQHAFLNRLAKGAIRATVAVRRRDADEAARPPQTYNVLLCCSPTHASELAHVLLEEHAPQHERKGWEIHFVAVWQPSVLPKRQIFVSIRTSRPDVDLSAISTRIIGGAGGGGHVAAAGFKIDGADVTSVFRPAANGPAARPEAPGGQKKD
jgi:hypothetical protein